MESNRTPPPAPATDPVTLFEQSMPYTDSRFEAKLTTVKKTGDQELNIRPYVVLKIHTDGTGGARAPKSIAVMEAIESAARREVLDLQKKIEFVQRWLVAAKRDHVELWV